MTKLLILIAVCFLIASMACIGQGSANPTLFPTPSGPALSVEEYAKACYAGFEELRNDRDRFPTQEQVQRYVMELRELVPPRSLEKFHYAHVRAWEVFVNEEILLAAAWMEADAQIGQLDDETYEAFRERNLCGLDENFFVR